MFSGGVDCIPKLVLVPSVPSSIRGIFMINRVHLVDYSQFELLGTLNPKP